MLNLPSFFDRLSVDTYSVMPDFLQGSQFNSMVSGQATRVAYGTYQQCFDEVAHLCRNDRKKYVYAYWAGFDMLAHGFGVGSEQVAAHFLELDQVFETMVDQLADSDSALLVSADHGFIDAPPETVWSWLVQMGYGRAGWYSYDQIDMDGESADTILEEFQELADRMLTLARKMPGFISYDTYLSQDGERASIIAFESAVPDLIAGGLIFAVVANGARRILKISR